MSDNVLGEWPAPNATLVAVVEQDDDVAYLYFWNPNGPQTVPRSVWIRNLCKAPESFTKDRMNEGLPPILPIDCVRHPDGAPPLEADALSFEWFPEGDGGVLFEGDDILVVVPPWAMDSGFSKDCLRETPVALPLPVDQSWIEDRIQSARRHWARWDEDTAWDSFRQSIEDAVVKVFGGSPRRFGATDEWWPPRELLQTPMEGGVALTTIGMSARPMPQVETYLDDAHLFRRIEIGMALSNECGDEVVQSARSYLSAQMKYPWFVNSWFGNGHTLPCDAIPPSWFRSYPFVLMTSRPPGAPVVELPDVDGDSVTLLWLVPITEKEQALAERDGSDAVLERLHARGLGWPHRRRKDVS